MIEVIYKDEKQEMKDGTTEWELPKNIRQIGLVSGDTESILRTMYIPSCTGLHRRRAVTKKMGAVWRFCSVKPGGGLEMAWYLSEELF